MIFVTKGHNAGRIGVLVSKDVHPSSFDIVHLKDRKGITFATRLSNTLCIGEANKPWISLPRGKGVRVDIIEQTKLKQTVTPGKIFMYIFIII